MKQITRSEALTIVERHIDDFKYHNLFGAEVFVATLENYNIYVRHGIIGYRLRIKTHRDTVYSSALVFKSKLKSAIASLFVKRGDAVRKSLDLQS